MNNVKEEISHIKKQSTKTIISYNFGQFASEFQRAAFLGLYFFFYETEVLLGIWFIVLANIIFAIWNAVNDPLAGYITERPTRFTKKWGKRFPWIIASIIPMFFIYILLFSPPNLDPEEGAWIIFLWFVIILCISDTLYSIWHVNFFGMFPDKFRTDEDRAKSGGIGTAIGQLGLIIGLLLPPMLYTFGDRASYVTMATICAGIGIIAVIIMIPGVREDKEMIDRYLQNIDQMEKESFYGTMKIALKQKNFTVYVIVYFLFQVLVVLALASLPYFVKYVLGMGANSLVILLLGLLLGLMGSIPLWVKLAKKYGFGKIFLVSGIAMGVLMVPLLFVSEIFGAFICFILVGVGIGGFWVMLMPVFSDVMDDVAVKTGKRQEGVYMGIRTFFARFSIIIMTIVLAVVHTATGFLADAPTGTNTQPAAAIWGIRVHMALIPLIAIFIGVLILWFFYDITEEKKQANRARLLELDL